MYILGLLKVKVTLRLTISQSVSWCRAPSGAHDQIFIAVWQLRSCFCGAPSLTRGRVCLLFMLLALASTVFLGSSPLGLATIFYCLQFETSLFIASYDSQGHGEGIRPRLHTGYSWPFLMCLYLYRLRVNPTENTTFHNSSIAVCLIIVR
jgi:hypothetical protein